MKPTSIDEYLADVPEPKRSTLQTVRETIMELIPDAEECISYSMPAFRLNGKVIAGIAAFKNHLSYMPHSGSVIEVIEDQLTDYKTSKGILQFAIDKPLPREIIALLIDVRISQVFPSA
jgi:uncharacterized protein YdhG (YjbR/CyaY superfamily)